MRFAVQRTAMLEALDRVVKVSSAHSANPVLGYAKVELVDGELFLSATDLSTRIVAQVQAPVHRAEDGCCLLPAAALASTLRSAPAEFLGLSTDAAQTTVHLGIPPTKYLWRTMPPDHFPDILTLNTEAETHTLERETFLAALKAVRSACSRSADPRFDQIGIRQGQLQASDGVRFHQALCEDASLVDVALPSSFVSDTASLLSASAEPKLALGISADHKAVSVRVGGVILMTRTHTEEWPDVSGVFTNARMSNQEVLKVSRDGLRNAIRRVRTLADPESGAVELRLGSDGYSSITVSAQQQSGSQASEDVAAIWTGDARTLTLHHQHLLHLLAMFDTDEVEMKLGPDTRTKPSSVLVEDGRRVGVLTQLRTGWRQR